MKRLATLLIALLLAFACAALYEASQQRTLVDDGFDLGTYLDSHEPHRRIWMHVLYLPLGRLVAAAGAGPGPYHVLGMLSAVAGALGLAALWLALRANGARISIAFTLALITGLTPVVWFYSTTVEVHAVHFAFVSIALCTVLLVPWRRTVLAHALASLACSGLFLSHQTGVLLVPALALLSLHAQRRQGLELDTRRALLRLVGCYGLATLLAIGLERWLRGGGDARTPLEFIRVYGGESASLGWWTRELLVPLGLLLPLALVALALRQGSLELRRAVGAALLVAIAFFGWWGVETRGGYFIGLVPFLALLAAEPVQRVVDRVGWSKIAATACVSFVLLVMYVFSGNTKYRPLDPNGLLYRSLIADHALPEGGILISLDPRCQPVDLYRPSIRELNASRRVALALAHGVDPHALAELIASETAAQCNELGGAVAIDHGFLKRSAGISRFEDFARSYWESIQARFGREPSAPPEEGFLVLRAAP